MQERERSLFGSPSPSVAPSPAAAPVVPREAPRPTVLAAGVDPIAHLDDCAGCAECEILERFFARCPACERWSATDSWPEPLRCLSCSVWSREPAIGAEVRAEREAAGRAALHRAFLALAKARV